MSAPGTAAENTPLIGIWVLDEGYQVSELLFRSDGRYQLETRSTDSPLDISSAERGFYEITGETLALTSYDYYGEPQPRRFTCQLAGSSLTLTRLEFEYTQVFQLKPGSTEDVLERQKVAADLVGTWGQTIAFYGIAEYTFRPGGYYFLKSTPSDTQFPPEFIRGRYEHDGTRLTVRPYSGVDAHYELDFFGTTVTFITREEFRSASTTYDLRSGSPEEVRAKAAEAAAFLSHENWQVGVWEIRDAIHIVDLTLRPDGHYIAQEATASLEGIVRGRYTLETGRIRLMPFVGQGLYARSNGEFGLVERTRELDYYDSELQFIDVEALSQSVTLARKRPGSDAPVLEKVRQAKVEREQPDWYIGIWEVNDPAGWMEFTWRPDRRYIAKSGSGGVPSQVERGLFRVAGDKVTLAPYAGLGPARGFELDLYDGEWFLIGDLLRMVAARKLPDSATGVIQKTHDPESMKGERGSILGLWTAPLPGHAAELVLRPDGEFRLSRCISNTLAQDYGLYTVDMTSRTLVSDSRFIDVQTLGLDFYGDTMTTFGGAFPPSTYTVNLGVVDAAIERSIAADAEKEQVDAQWLTRVPVGPRNPDAVQFPTADIPADPNPTRVFDGATVFTNFQFYRRLTPGFVYFNVQGTIQSVPVVNTSEWYFFPTGRTLVRFKNYRAGFPYPNTVADISDSWGAYRIDAKPTARDILHLYADNAFFIELDRGEQSEMTLEDGRRHLFWGKNYQLLSEWASEQRPIPCDAPATVDLRLMNTGVSLSTTIPPDAFEPAPTVAPDRVCAE